eukprot:gnl/TRDRNA2_/TRDRNA2_164984_c0_seq1.p1 gnl/TRDRNA2_/TRDRNA2_164984_c0~~gnl/TRDRNA2_/TRDRNA2_164984_c0_seq1.p1  ORF type:complete len:971 (+),score=310.52 gnl/TRDRNA2_/TRDRNA2_164984_c0_seq1:99-3011(+)
MGKKTKTGKGRLDKFYHLAKDQGYRARSAFKLIQLAKKFDFLSAAKVCIDLCAAPGSWSQVAERNMPKGAQIIAIDLAPIKPIRGVTILQQDITTDKCRQLLKKELQGGKADCVLHDGAPNVGSSWAKDAYGQSELTLHSCKLACEHLRPGGTFVTKVFRSADYNSLMWVFTQLFTKVDATKPTASRNVSAEIFVLCMGYKAPGKVDPRFFDAKWVFMDSSSMEALTDGPTSAKGAGGSLNDLLKSSKKRHRSGYEIGDDHKVVSALDYVKAENAAQILVTFHKINLEAEGCEEINKNPLTTEEVRELCQDLQILGKRDLGCLLKWRMKLRREHEKNKKPGEKDTEEDEGKKGASAAAAAAEKKLSKALEKEAGVDSDDGSEGDGEDDDKELQEQVEARRKAEKRAKKKTMMRQKKQEWRKKISLTTKGGVQDESELFKGKKSNVDLLAVEDQYVHAKLEDGDSDSGDDEDDEESDSDDELDRLTRLEVDMAVDHELRQLRLEDKHRSTAQRRRKGKKESRRQQVLAAWSGELREFNKSIDDKASADYALMNKDSDDEDDDDEDDETNLLALRDAQRSAAQESTPMALEDGSTIDAAAMEGNLNIARTKSSSSSSSSALVPAEDAVKSAHRASRWFSQDIFKNLGGDEGDSGTLALRPLDRNSESEISDFEQVAIREVDDSKLPSMPLTDKQKRSQKRKKELERKERQNKKAKPDEEEDDKRPMEIAPLQPPQSILPGKKGPQKPSDPQELAETLALGSVLTESKKSRMDLIDAAYNRWTFEGDEGLPDWFTEEENKYNKPELPVTKELMDQFRAKLREINARPIRKVLEAKARKRKRMAQRIEKLRKGAMSLIEVGDMSDAMKARQMRKLVSKAARAEERKVQVVAIKKGGGGKTDKKKAPKGAKVKVVDRRLKKDRRALKRAEKRKSGGKPGGRKGHKQKKKGHSASTPGGGAKGGAAKESGGKRPSA